MIMKRLSLLLAPGMLLPVVALAQVTPGSPFATNTVAGKARCDGTTITCGAGGVITAISSAPSGAAGGVLSGTYPNPGFASTTGSGATVLATGATLSGGTLSGTTTLPGSGQISSTGWLGLGGTPLAMVDLQGGISAADNSTNSYFLRLRGQTITNTTSSGTVTNVVAFLSSGTPTLAATNPTTYTNAQSYYLGGPPVAGSNVTITNSYTLRIASGNSVFGGNLGIQNNPSLANLVIGATAGTARIYNSFSDASNGEWAYLGSWGPTANVATFGTAHNGSGVARDVSLVYDGTERIRLVTGGVNLPSLPSDATHTDNTVCADTSTGLLYKGSGAVGICLGTSSARFKHDIAPLRPGLAQIMALQPVSYRYNKGYGDDGARELYGFTAEQVAEVLPKLVGRDAEGRPNSVDWAGMVPVLVRAIQELKEGR
jgi:hypothetical protein